MPAPALIVTARNALVKLAALLDWLPPLATRIIVGAVFAPNGWGKLHNLKQVSEYFVGELHMPPFMVPVVATTELVAGVLLLLGLGTRVAAGAILVLMIGALKTAVVPNFDGWDQVSGFGATAWSMLTGDLQDPLHKASEFWYLIVAAWLAATGGGKVSLDWLLDRFWLKGGQRG